MKIKITHLFWTLILFACSSGIVSPETSIKPTKTIAPQPGSDSTSVFPPDSQPDPPSGPKIIVTAGTPNIGQPPDGNFPNTGATSESCAFSWAQYRIDDLSQEFDASLKDLNPGASGYASAFGEDCIYQDGRKKFGAIETDFYIDLPVSDLTDYGSFGDWIAQSMPVVNSMPEDMIQGPQKGFVEYKFHTSEMDSIVVRVSIRVYNDSAIGNDGEILFLLFCQPK